MIDIHCAYDKLEVVGDMKTLIAHVFVKSWFSTWNIEKYWSAKRMTVKYHGFVLSK